MEAIRYGSTRTGEQALSEAGVQNLQTAIVKQAVEDYQNAIRFVSDPDLSFDYSRVLEKHECGQSLTKSEKKLRKLYEYHKKMILECEQFFTSESYQMLCDIPGEQLMLLVRQKLKSYDGNTSVNK